MLCALALAVVGCGSVRTEGLADGGPLAHADARTPAGEAGTSSTPLPGSAGKTTAAWTCSGGGSISSETGYLGVSIGSPASVGSVTAPGGARVTLGHFADTVEP